VDAIGTGLLRPFLLIYGIDALRLPALTAGLAMTAGVAAGLGLGALLATASLTGGPPALRALAAGTGVSYLLSAALAWSVRIRQGPAPPLP